MAVSGKTAAPHEVPYALDNDKPTSVPVLTKAMADRVHLRLDAIAPKQIVGATKKQLLIANASGVVTAVTASGDVTNDESGVFTVADGAVTSRKFKPTEGIKTAENDMSPGETLSDITLVGGNLVIVPAVASILRITAVFGVQMAGVKGGALYCNMTGTINVDGSDQTAKAEYQAYLNSTAELQAIEDVTIAQVYRIPLTAASHTIKMRAARANAGTVKVWAGKTQMLYELVAA
jgi:hypothetical protein